MTVPPTQAPVHTPIADYAFKVCQDVKGTFDKAHQARKQEFKDQGITQKVAYYAAKVFEFIGAATALSAFATAVITLPIVVIAPVVGLLSLACLAVGGLGILAMRVSQAVQKRFEKITENEQKTINILTQHQGIRINEKNKDNLPGALLLKLYRTYIDGFLEPVKQGHLGYSGARNELRSVLALAEGKKDLEEAEKDPKKLTPGQVKLIQNLGTMSAVYHILEAVQHVAANRLEEAKKSMKKYDEIPGAAFPVELAAKVTPLVVKLKAPTADFQEKVYKELTKKEMPKGLEAQIGEAIAKDGKEPKKFEFKLSNLDAVAALA